MTDDLRECQACGEGASYLSSREWCDGCEELSDLERNGGDPGLRPGAYGPVIFDACRCRFEVDPIAPTDCPIHR